MFKIFLLLSFLTPTIASAAIFNNACAGDLIVTEAIGGGLTWGAVVLRW